MIEYHSRSRQANDENEITRLHPNNPAMWANAAYTLSHFLGEVGSTIQTGKMLYPAAWAHIPIIKENVAILKRMTDRGERVDPSAHRTVWERTAALVGFFLLMKSLCPLPWPLPDGPTGNEGRRDDAGLDAWMSSLVKAWIDDPQAIICWPILKSLMDKIDEWWDYVVDWVVYPDLTTVEPIIRYPRRGI